MSMYLVCFKPGNINIDYNIIQKKYRQKPKSTLVFRNIICVSKNIKLSIITIFFFVPLLNSLLAGTTTAFYNAANKLNVDYQVKIDNQPFSNGLRLLTQPNIQQKIILSGCRGEVRSSLISIKANKNLKKLNIYSTKLVADSIEILPSSVNIRAVKWWYQGKGDIISRKKPKVYVRELLLKDSELVKVNKVTKENYLRSTEVNGSEKYILCSGTESKDLKAVRPMDTATLQPISLKKGQTQEYWINLKIPETSLPGIYYSTLKMTTDHSEEHHIPLQLTVYPFDLQPSPLKYAIYYRAKLSQDGRPTIGSEYKSTEQYEAELLNMKEHGVVYPANYEKYTAKLHKALDIRQKIDLPTDAFFNLGQQTGNAKDSKKLALLQIKIQSWVELLGSYGYKNVYFYGMDEAKGKRLMSQKVAWQAVHKAGGKNFVATYNKEIDNAIDNMGSLLDAPILSGKVDSQYARKWHKVGSKVFSYGNPQVGEEDPEKYRRNYGLLLYKTGYDGAMDYAYQHGYHHIWNDFDDPRYRDHVFAYPTINGVVDTIAWEGFREGTYDVRYAATFLEAIKNSTDKRLAQNAKFWYKQIDPSKDDLDIIRDQLVGWIFKLTDSIKY